MTVYTELLTKYAGVKTFAVLSTEDAGDLAIVHQERGTFSYACLCKLASGWEREMCDTSAEAYQRAKSNLNAGRPKEGGEVERFTRAITGSLETLVLMKEETPS